MRLPACQQHQNERATARVFVASANYESKSHHTRRDEYKGVWQRMTVTSNSRLQPGSCSTFMCVERA